MRDRCHKPFRHLPVLICGHLHLPAVTHTPPDSTTFTYTKLYSQPQHLRCGYPGHDLMQTFLDQTTFHTSPNTQCSCSSIYRHPDINGWCDSTPTMEMPDVSTQKHTITLNAAFDLHGQSSFIYIFNLWSPTFVPTSVQWRYSAYLLPSFIVAYGSHFCATKITWSCLSGPP